MMTDWPSFGLSSKGFDLTIEEPLLKEGADKKKPESKGFPAFFGRLCQP
jgi:hypothetical protein